MSSWNQRYADGDTPWDFEEPSSELVRLMDQFPPEPSSRVFEAGCGTGANAVYLARRGLEVTAVDIAPLALERARRRAQEAGVKIDFRELDLLAPAEDLLEEAHRQPFSYVFDRGVYHILRRVNLFAYLKTLEQLSAPDALLVVLAGNANETGPHSPPSVRDYELCHELSPLFNMLQLREFRFDGIVKGQKISPLAWSAVLRRRPRD